jgi:hypothetical protein
MIFLLIAACTDTEKDSDTVETERFVSHYYSGDSHSVVTYNGETGSDEPPERTMIRKTYDTINSTMEEAVYTPQEEYVLTIEIEGMTFSGIWESPMGTLEVVGSYGDGEQWKWTEWESTSTVTEEIADCDPQQDLCLMVGDYFQSTDTISGETLTAIKSLHTEVPEYELLEFEITETLKVIDQETFEAELAELQAGN